MNIILISEDDGLRRICSEVLSEFSGLRWRLAAVGAADCPQDADLYIWDNHGRIATPLQFDPTPSRHLFIIDPDDITRFCEGNKVSPRVVLPKPVTHACLSAFLGLAVAAAQERVSIVNSLRADRDEILQCLIQSNLYIQNHNRDRSNVLARVVHDLEAPLMTANGYCGLLVSEALGPQNEEQKEVLRRMQRSIKRLSRMASAMLEMSVGRLVKREPDLRPVDIRECIEQALREVTPLADDKQISLSVDVAPGHERLFLKPGQIEQVLINILGNACKFTPKAGEIVIRGYPFFWERRAGRAPATILERRFHCLHEPNSYRVDIRDSGARIPREQLTTMFEEDTSYTGGSDRSGGGLGLAICKMILHAHQGRVWAENSDVGPRFSFVLPVRAAEAEAADCAGSFASLANGHLERR
jgi:signal transduction histidine kinase